MTVVVKLCPRCGEEYVPTAERCIDCGVPLVLEGAPSDPGAAAATPEPAAEGAMALDPAELVLLREAEVAWARRLAEALEEAGVPCRVAPIAAPASGVQGAWSGRWGVFVRPADGRRAAEVDTALLREEIPELEAAPLRAADGPGGHEESGPCPGCGHDLAPDAAECPECGLAFA